MGEGGGSWKTLDTLSISKKLKDKESFEKNIILYLKSKNYCRF